ncbi:hypothetical protein [Halorussus salinus]|nr:hypothetical protein [Halorussus salinus]
METAVGIVMVNASKAPARSRSLADISSARPSLRSGHASIAVGQTTV